MNISKIHKMSLTALSLCLILSLNSALAVVDASTPQKQVATTTPKKEVKKPVKVTVKKKVVKKIIKKEASKTYNVSIQNFAFTPPELKIKVGDKVTFTQKDSTSHTVDTDPHPDHTQLPGFDSGSLSQGQSYTHTFTKAGTFTYHCSPHPSMKGKIIVEE